MRATPVDAGPSVRTRAGALRWIRTAGPTLISASSDIDPTSIGALAVIGSTVVYGLNWLVLAIVPLLAAELMLATRIGLVSEQGLQKLVRRRFAPVWSWAALATFVVVNIITLGADIGAGAAAVGLFFHGRAAFFVIPFALGTGLLLQFGTYRMLKRVLLWLLLAFLAYVASAFAAHPDWAAALHDTVVPQFHWNSEYIGGAIAIIGGTMTGYVYLWQTIEEASERRSLRAMRREEMAAPIGVAWTTMIGIFILIATGSTLGQHGVRATTAAQAAQALRPIAGSASTYLFAVGLFGSAALALPVLAGTTASAVAETLGWREGVDQPVERRAVPFYAVLWVSIALGAAIPLFGFPAISLLFYGSIVGAVGLPLQLALLALIARDREVMGEHRAGVVVTAFGWCAVAVATGAFGLLVFRLLVHGGI